MFRSTRGGPLTRDGSAYIIEKYGKRCTKGTLRGVSARASVVECAGDTGMTSEQRC
jgi:hypothetical protein